MGPWALSGDAAVQKGRVREIPTGVCLDVCFGVGMFFIFIFWKRAPHSTFPAVTRAVIPLVLLGAAHSYKPSCPPSVRRLPDAGAASGARSDHSHLLSATHGVCRTRRWREMWPLCYHPHTRLLCITTSRCASSLSQLMHHPCVRLYIAPCHAVHLQHLKLLCITPMSGCASPHARCCLQRLPSFSMLCSGAPQSSALLQPLPAIPLPKSCSLQSAPACIHRGLSFCQWLLRAVIIPLCRLLSVHLQVRLMEQKQTRPECGVPGVMSFPLSTLGARGGAAWQCLQ